MNQSPQNQNNFDILMQRMIKNHNDILNLQGQINDLRSYNFEIEQKIATLQNERNNYSNELNPIYQQIKFLEYQIKLMSNK